MRPRVEPLPKRVSVPCQLWTEDGGRCPHPARWELKFEGFDELLVCGVHLRSFEIWRRKTPPRKLRAYLKELLDIIQWKRIRGPPPGLAGSEKEVREDEGTRHEWDPYHFMICTPEPAQIKAKIWNEGFVSSSLRRRELVRVLTSHLWNEWKGRLRAMGWTLPRFKRVMTEHKFDFDRWVKDPLESWKNLTRRIRRSMTRWSP